MQTNSCFSKNPWKKFKQKGKNTLRKGIPRKQVREIAFDILKEYGTCCYCAIELNEKTFTVEHLQPISRGGNNSKENIEISCKRCNSQKKAQTDEKYVTSKGFVGRPKLKRIIFYHVKNGEKMSPEIIIKISKQKKIDIPRRYIDSFISTCMDKIQSH